MTLRPCRYLCRHECKYWDMELTEDETLPCMWPGLLTCYESDGKGCIYENGKWMTVEEYSDWVYEQNQSRLPDMLDRDVLLHLNSPTDILRKNRDE